MAIATCTLLEWNSFLSQLNTPTTRLYSRVLNKKSCQSKRCYSWWEFKTSKPYNYSGRECCWKKMPKHSSTNREHYFGQFCRNLARMFLSKSSTVVVNLVFCWTRSGRYSAYLGGDRETVYKIWINYLF